MKKIKNKNIELKAAMTILLILISLLGRTQTIDTNEILDKFAYMNTQLRYNKLYLATDKHFYFSSDTIFFQAYLTDPQTNTLAKGKAICYFDLLNDQNQIREQVRIRTIDGLGAGYFVPQESIKTDEYFIVAYSGSMKNYHSDFYFNKKILIYNGCLEEENDNSEQIFMNFYAEGGNFVEGNFNRISFEIPLGNKNSVPDQVVIKSDIGTDSVIAIVDINGVGTFELNHKKGRKYYAQFYDQGKVVNTILPKFSNAGLGLKTDISLSFINLELLPSKSLSESNKNFYLFFYQGSNLLFLEEFKISDRKKIVYKLPKNNMITGLSQLVILNEDMKVVNERLIYIDKKTVGIKATVVANSIIKTKSKLTAEIRNVSTSGISGTSIFSTSSVNKVLYDFYPDLEPNIITYQYLTSELNDRVFNPNYYFSKNGKQHINNMLITKKSNRVNWSKLLTENIKEQKIYYNRSALSFQGEASFLNSKDPVIDTIPFSFYMSKMNMLFETYTSEKGKVDVRLLFDFEGEGIVIYKAILNDKQSSEDILLNIETPSSKISYDRLNGVKSKYRAKMILRNDQVREANRLIGCSDYIEAFHKRNVLSKDINRSYNYYLKKDKVSNDAKNENGDIFSNLVYQSDLTRNLDDYISLESMHLVVKEILHDVVLRKRKGDYKLRIYNREIVQSFDGSPLFIIDGSPTYDLNKFLNLKPADVQTIDVISSHKNLNVFGNIGSYGVLVVKSKTGKEVVFEKQNIFKLNGFQKNYIKSYPEYNKSDTNEIPDFRSTVYWNPLNKTNAQGIGQFEYFHSDDVSDFIINIQGINETGQPFQKQVTYKATF